MKIKILKVILGVIRYSTLIIAMIGFAAAVASYAIEPAIFSLCMGAAYLLAQLADSDLESIEKSKSL